jgi:hypothetical protein
MAPRKRDSWLPELFFIAGALLILITFAYSLLRRWPTFDPLVTSLLAGIGLMLIVIYERLGLMLRELRHITTVLDREPEHEASAAARPPDDRGADGRADPR